MKFINNELLSADRCNLSFAKSTGNVTRPFWLHPNSSAFQSDCSHLGSCPRYLPHYQHHPRKSHDPTPTYLLSLLRDIVMSGFNYLTLAFFNGAINYRCLHLNHVVHPHVPRENKGPVTK